MGWLVLALVAILAIVVTERWIHKRLYGYRPGLPEPRRPFLTELEERKLERELGIGLPAPAVFRGPFPNIKNANGDPCYELTRDDVIAIATELIAAGKAQDVKAALSDFNTARVTQLEDDQLAAFVSRMNEYAGMDEDPIDGPF